MEFFRVIIAGSRTFRDYDLLVSHTDKMLSRVKRDHNIIVLSGRARGADKLGEQYALSRGYEIETYPADWEKYGRVAGYLRNKQMAENADALIVFWDGKSRGTAHMINIAKEHGLKISIKRYE